MILHKQSSYSLGVIGYPLGHSLSPRLHEAALHASGLSGEYRLYPILPLPAGHKNLKALLGSFRDGRLDGLNVTIPHKQAVIAYLNELTPLAMQIGAVNTIYRRGRILIGDNTDAPGFMADLQKQCPKTETPQTALVLGGGGAARAVVYALLSAGWHVAIVARRPETAQVIKAAFSGIDHPCEVISWGSLPEYVLSFENLQRESHEMYACTSRCNHRSLSLLVNTTPVGMTPDNAQSPWPENLPFPREAFVYDLVYNPLETTLVRTARKARLMAVGGLGMLIEQAALAFECWTGFHPPIEVIRQVITMDAVVSSG